MASLKNHLTSARSGCHKLTSVLECLDKGLCTECGRGSRLTRDEAQQLDGKIWDALRFAEALR